MSIYQQGTSVDTTGLTNVNPKQLQVGGEYIWQYWVSATTFMFLTADQVNTVITTLINLKQKLSDIDPNEIDPPINISGVAIDTDTGNIWIRGVITASSKDPNVQEADVNPWVIAGVIGGIFATIGAAVLLRGVYQVVGYVLGINTGGTPGGPPALDPCNNPGVINYFKCLGQESKWFLIGALFGIMFLIIFLFVKYGPKEGTA